jgi:hypothetical protein
MDSRIEPLAMLGLRPGDAKILRNAGARVTDDVLRTLVLATYLLGVRRVMVITHTDCRMTGTEEEVHAAVLERGWAGHAKPGVPDGGGSCGPPSATTSSDCGRGPTYASSRSVASSTASIRPPDAAPASPGAG